MTQPVNRRVGLCVHGSFLSLSPFPSRLFRSRCLAVSLLSSTRRRFCGRRRIGAVGQLKRYSRFQLWGRLRLAAANFHDDRRVMVSESQHERLAALRALDTVALGFGQLPNEDTGGPRRPPVAPSERHSIFSFSRSRSLH